ncbi:MAG: hypothetical protein EHM70_26475 [Chloroflexota bacterium]|nr:MAG: hypothetical protein EHM70_26475 [Chloroflexota bacterium]
MKKFFVLFMTVIVLVGLIATAVFAADTQVWYKLIAGQQWHVGNIGVSIDANGDLHVVYKAFEGYCLNEIQTHAAYDLADIPQNNGNPTPGQFDYKADDLGCVYRAEAVIPGDWDASREIPIYVAAHAVVGMVDDPEWSETGWGLWCGVKNLDRFGFPGSNWATYILYTGELKTLNPYR